MPRIIFLLILFVPAIAVADSHAGAEPRLYWEEGHAWLAEYPGD